MALLTADLSPIQVLAQRHGSECFDHADCGSNKFCGPFQKCIYCAEFHPWVSSCPEKCICSTHQECAAFEGLPYQSMYNGTELIPSTRGMFCAPYDASDDDEFGAVSVCTSCQVLNDIGLFVPEQDNAAGYCSDIPCLCATSSDCPDDHYCASDISAYAPDGYEFFKGDHWPDGNMGPCHGYCVSCTRGCLDDAIVYQGNSTTGTDNTPPPTCRDVCDPKYVECDTHAECHNGGWCSANHQCNSCSPECADSLVAKKWDREQVFPSIDGACPLGCCGWGMNPDDWDVMRPFPDDVAPCNATNETEFYAAVLRNYDPDSTPLTVNYTLTYGVPCVVKEADYWQSARKAALFDCAQVEHDLYCTEYPVRWVFMIKANSSENYTFMFEEINLTVRGDSKCKLANNPSSSSQNSLGAALAIGIVLFFGCLSILTCAEFFRGNGRSASHGVTASAQSDRGNVPSSPPAAVPASLFEFAAVDTPPHWRATTFSMEDLTESTAVGRAAPTGPGATSATTVESDDEA